MIVSRMWYGGLNPYDLYRDCFNPFPIDQQTKLRKVGERFYCSMRGLTNDLVAEKLERMMVKKAAPVTDDKDEIEIIADPICMDSSAITHYMNLPEVRQALNIPSNVPDWTHCRFDQYFNADKLTICLAPRSVWYIRSNIMMLRLKSKRQSMLDYVYYCKSTIWLFVLVMHSW
jgi:hypothetical protein